MTENKSALGDSESKSPVGPVPSETPGPPLLGEKLTILAQTFEDAPDGIHVTDMTGNIVYANKAITRMFGWTPEEQMSMHVNEFNVDSGLADKHIIPSLNSTGRWEGEVMVKHKSGRTFPIWLTTSVVKDDQGEPIALTGIMRDISELNRSKELSDGLNDVNGIINSTLDFSAVVDDVMSSSAAVLGVDSVAFFLPKGNHWVLEHVHGPSPHESDVKLLCDMLNPPPRMDEDLIPVAISNAYNDDRANNKMARKIGLRSLMSVPLGSSRRVLGMLAFCYFTEQVELTGEEIDFCTKLGASISLALENGRLFSEQQSIAGTLQEALLSVPEGLPGVEFEHFYRSATKAALVGGDFYDLFVLQGTKIGIVIGDVSGKGLEAAAVSSMLKHMIKSHAYEGHSPSTIITKTNRMAIKEMNSSTFATVFVGVLDAQSGVLTYCCAGHPPPIIKRQNGEIDLLDTSCLPVGMFDFLDAQDRQLIIEEGDMITLYTDGVTEARCQGKMFGESRLIDLIKRAKPPSAIAAIQPILDELTDQCGCQISDDLAIVSLSLKNDSQTE